MTVWRDTIGVFGDVDVLLRTVLVKVCVHVALHGTAASQWSWRQQDDSWSLIFTCTRCFQWATGLDCRQVSSPPGQFQIRAVVRLCSDDRQISFVSQITSLEITVHTVCPDMTNLYATIQNFDWSDNRTPFHFISVHLKLAQAQRRQQRFWFLFAW